MVTVTDPVRSRGSGSAEGVVGDQRAEQQRQVDDGREEQAARRDVRARGRELERQPQDDGAEHEGGGR